MSYKCINCPWGGDELSKESKGDPLDDKCPVCGDEVEGKGKKEEFNMDLNNDGVVDSKDASIAGRVLSRISRQKKSKK